MTGKESALLRLQREKIALKLLSEKIELLGDPNLSMEIFIISAAINDAMYEIKTDIPLK